MNELKNLHELSEQELEQELELRRKEKLQKAKRLERKYRTDKDDFLKYGAAKFQQLHNELAEFKAHVISEAEKLYEQMYAIKGKEPREINQFSLTNEDQTIKIIVERQDRLSFTEESKVPMQIIRDGLNDRVKTKFARDMINTLLSSNRKQEYSPSQLAKLRRNIEDSNDEKLIDAFDEFMRFQVVVGTSMYARCQVRDENGKWRDVVLQFSAL